MTAPYFSGTADLKTFSGIGLSSTNYTFGCNFFISSTVGALNTFMFQATSVLAESSIFRPALRHTSAANTFELAQVYATTQGVWVFSATDNKWHSLYIVHNRDSVTPTPIIYLDRSAIAVTVNTIPSGALVLPSAGVGYSIGGRIGFAATRMMRGYFQNVVWSTDLWTKAQCDQFASAPGSFMQNVTFYYPFARPDMNEDYSNNSQSLSSGQTTLGPTDHNATVSGGLRQLSLLRVGL